MPFSDEAEVLDLRGLACPEPILRLARTARGYRGRDLVVVADDAAFPADLRAWCRTTGAALEELEVEDEGYWARVSVPEKRSAALGSQVEGSLGGEGAGAAGRYTLDCRGESCPAPVMATARAARRVPAGTIMEVMADDPAFPLDIEAWCRASGNELLSVEDMDDAKCACLAIVGREPRPSSATSSATPTRERCTLLVLHSDFESLFAAFTVANGALAQGMDVALYFSFWSINVLRSEGPSADGGDAAHPVQRLLKAMMPRGARRQRLGKMHMAGVGKGLLTWLMKKKNVMSINEMLEALVEGGARFVVCTMSMEIMGIEERDLLPLPNLSMAGVSAFVEDARGASISLVF